MRRRSSSAGSASMARSRSVSLVGVMVWNRLAEGHGPPRAPGLGAERRSSAQLLLLEQLVEPLAIVVVDAGGGVALVVDARGESALVVGPTEGRVQVEHRVA